MEDDYKNELRALCKGNLKFLCKEVLGFKDWDDNLHGDMAKWLKSTGKKKLVLVPRGHLKTSIVTVGYTIQCLLNNFEERILIMNAVWDFARDVLAQIQDFMTVKSALPQLFGTFNGPTSTWTRDKITVSQRTKATGKEPSISTAGLETVLTGRHYDRIVLDDLVNRENITTKEQIEKVVKRYRDCLDLLDPGGELVIVGTRWASTDLYGQIMASEMSSINGIALPTTEDRAAWRQKLPDWH